MRALVRILGVVVALAVLAGAAEVALRLIIPNVIANAVREQVGLSEDHPVDVSLGGSALLHAVTGRVGDVTIGVDDLPLPGGIVVNARLHADSAPFDPSSGDLRGGTGAVVNPCQSRGPGLTRTGTARPLAMEGVRPSLEICLLSCRHESMIAGHQPPTRTLHVP